MADERLTLIVCVGVEVQDQEHFGAFFFVEYKMVDFHLLLLKVEQLKVLDLSVDVARRVQHLQDNHSNARILQA